MKTGIELIAQERDEQIKKHGRTVKGDVKNNSRGELSFAAARLCPTDMWLFGNPVEQVPSGWDKQVWRKIVAKTYRQRLIIAGALIAAEIDRLNALD